MKVSARSAGGQVCILHLARFNDFPGTKIVAIEPVQKTKPREKMVYFSLTAKLEWLTLVRVRPAATARAHSRSRNAFGEKTLTSCLTRVGGPEIVMGGVCQVTVPQFFKTSDACRSCLSVNNTSNAKAEASAVRLTPPESAALRLSGYLRPKNVWGSHPGEFQRHVPACYSLGAVQGGIPMTVPENGPRSDAGGFFLSAAEERPHHGFFKFLCVRHSFLISYRYGTLFCQRGRVVLLLHLS